MDKHISTTAATFPKSETAVCATTAAGRPRLRDAATRLRVVYDGETICEPTAVATLIKTFAKVADKYGFEEILKMGLRRRGHEGRSCFLFEKVLPKGQREVDYAKPDFAKGYWMRTKSGTDEKAVQLNDLKTLLSLEMAITQIA